MLMKVDDASFYRLFQSAVYRHLQGTLWRRSDAFLLCEQIESRWKGYLLCRRQQSRFMQEDGGKLL